MPDQPMTPTEFYADQPRAIRVADVVQDAVNRVSKFPPAPLHYTTYLEEWEEENG